MLTIEALEQGAKFKVNNLRHQSNAIGINTLL